MPHEPHNRFLLIHILEKSKIQLIPAKRGSRMGTSRPACLPFRESLEGLIQKQGIFVISR